MIYKMLFIYIYIYIYIRCAFVCLDNELYKMHSTYIKRVKNVIVFYIILYMKLVLLYKILLTVFFI